jgi:hypothetical protein
MRRVQQLRANRAITTLATPASSSFNGCFALSDENCATSSLSNAAHPNNSIIPDLYLINNSESWFTNLESSFTPGGDNSAVYDDAQFIWSTFMDDVNMDYTNDLPNGTF